MKSHFEPDRWPLVYIIILNWNQLELTLDCLDSLAQQDYPSFQVVVVDNGSTDGSSAMLRERFPGATILEIPENIGYSPGNNVGIKHALEQGADYMFLLNNDTVVDPHMLSHLVTVAESEPGIGMTGPTMLYFDEPEVIWCAGAGVDWRNGATVRLLADQSLSLVEQAACQDVDFISSCAVCIKSCVCHAIGLMDDRYFIYYDETDWFARASAAGWRSVYVPWAKIWHKVSATMGTTSPATDYYMNRNVLLFLAENQRGLARLRSLMLAAGRNLLAVAAYTVKPHGGQRLPHRNARLLALRDAMLGRWGKMGPDVAAVCYQANG